MRIKIGKWSLLLTRPLIRTNDDLDHKCLNQIMDGTYECEYCYPPCRICGRDTSSFGVNCNRFDGCTLPKTVKEKGSEAEK